MSKLDDRIRDALSADENESPTGSELSMWQSYYAVFKGRNRVMVIFVHFEIFIILALFVLAWVKLLQADELTLDALRWGVGAVLCLMVICFLKMWTWAEMNKLSIRREIKRLELQVAHLSENLQKEKSD